MGCNAVSRGGGFPTFRVSVTPAPSGVNAPKKIYMNMYVC